MRIRILFRGWLTRLGTYHLLLLLLSDFLQINPELFG